MENDVDKKANDLIEYLLEKEEEKGKYISIEDDILVFYNEGFLINLFAKDNKIEIYNYESFGLKNLKFNETEHFKYPKNQENLRISLEGNVLEIQKEDFVIEVEQIINSRNKIIGLIKDSFKEAFIEEEEEEEI